MHTPSEQRKAQLIRWYFQAVREPERPASKRFIRSQADFGQYPPIQRSCAAIMAKRERAAFSEARA